MPYPTEFIEKNRFSMHIMVIFLLLMFQSGNAQDQLLLEADQAMATGKYKQALTIYRKIDSMGYGSQALFANMAIASASLNQRVDVILYLEKAKKYQPASREIRALATQILPDNNVFSESESTFTQIANQCTGYLSDDGWSWCVLFFITTLLAFSWYSMTRQGVSVQALARHKPWQLVVLLLGLVFSVLAAGYRHHQIYNNQGVMIMATNCALKMGPDQQSPALMQLEAGTKVQFQESLENGGK